MTQFFCIRIQGESAIPSHEANMSELSIEYAAALEREKELGKRYDDLFNFLQSHVKESQVNTKLQPNFYMTRNNNILRL